MGGYAVSGRQEAPPSSQIPQKSAPTHAPATSTLLLLQTVVRSIPNELCTTLQMVATQES